MEYADKTKEQLIKELKEFRKRINKLEIAESERMRMEKTIRLQSEVVENMTEGIYLIRTSDGMIVYANHTFENIFGYDSGELVNKHVSIVNAPTEKSSEETAKEIIRSLKKRGAWSGEVRNIKKDGTQFWCRANVSTFVHPDYGEVWVSVHEDVTDRKMAEDELKKHRENLEILVAERTSELEKTNEQLKHEITERKKIEEILQNTSNSLANAQRIAKLGNWDWDIENNELFWSDEIYCIFGLKPQEFGANYDAFLNSIHPDDREFVQKSVDKALYEKKPYSIEHRIVLPDGTERIVHEQAETTFDKDGKPIYMSGVVHDITEQKQLERDLKERIKELNGLYNLGKLSEKNEDLEELIIRFIKDIVPPSMQFPDKVFSKVELYKKKYLSFGKKDLCKNSNCLSASIIIGGEKKGKLCIGYTEDLPFIEEFEQNLINGYAERLGKIIEKSEAEEAVITIKARLEHLLVSSPAVIYSCEASGNYPATFISENVKSQLGYEPQEFVDDPSFWSNHIHPDDKSWVFTGLAHLFETGHHVHEYRFKQKDGIYIWMYDEMKLVYDQQGNLLEIVGYWIDITKRKKAEEALRESEERFRLIFNNASDGLLITDPRTTKFIDGNKKIQDMTGYSLKELLDLDISGIVPPEELPRVMEEFEKQIRGEQPLALSIPVLRKDGKVFYADINSSPLVLDGIQYLVGIFRDVTERKKLEEEKINCSKLEAINNMVVTINHEMNQPLSVICSNSEFLLNDVEKDSEIYKDLKIIKAEAWRLAELVRKTQQLKHVETTEYTKGVKMIDLGDDT